MRGADEQTGHCSATINLGMVGVGTTQHFVAEAFQAATDARFTAILYRTTGAVIGQVRAGEAVALAVSTAARVRSLSEIPTVAEAAALHGFDLPAWYALALLATAPANAVERLHDAILQSLQESDLRRRLDELGLIRAGSTQ